MTAAPSALINSQVRDSYRASTVSIPARCIANNSNRTNKKNYSIAKLECLNECVAAVLPLSGAEWEMVSHSHCVYYPGRTWESLRKKFNEVARKSIPTGDPNCPPYVREAKRVRQQIIEKSEGASGSPSEDFPFPLDDESETNEDEDGEDIQTPRCLCDNEDSDDVSSNCRRPTPLTRRGEKHSRANGEASFNDVCMLMLAQQNADRAVEREEP